MKNGKSAEIITKTYDDIQEGKNVLLFTSGKDNRYGIGKIASRIPGLEPLDAIPVYDDTDIFDIVKTHNPDIIRIDEVQFFSKYNIISLETIAIILDIPIFAYGIKNSAQNTLFEGAEYMFVYATRVVERERNCYFCTEKANRNLRIENGIPDYGGMEVKVGDENYLPVCAYHFYNPVIEKLNKQDR